MVVRSVSTSPISGDSRPLASLMVTQRSRYPTEESVLTAFTTPLSGIALDTVSGPKSVNEGLDRWCIQRTIDRSFMDGGGEVLIPAGNYQLDKPLFLRSGVLLRGEGSLVTQLWRTATCNVGLISASRHTGSDLSLGPVGDSDGFILRWPTGTYLNLADCPSFRAPPIDGSWSFGWDIRWDGGPGYVWGLGGALRLADIPDRWSVAIAHDGRLQVFGANGGAGGGGWGPILEVGEWYVCKLSFKPDGVATLTVNGTDYSIVNNTGPMVPRWHDDFIIGGKPTIWPEVISSEAIATGRIKNLRLAERYGQPPEMHVPLTDGNSLTFDIPNANFGLTNGYLMVRCSNDGHGEIGWSVRDLAVRSFQGGIGAYITNAQQFNMTDVILEGFRGLFMHKNDYQFSIRNVDTHGQLVATQAVNNAFQGSYNGGMCKGGLTGFVSENSYGAVIEKTWITTCQRVPLLLSGRDCVVGADRVYCYDESAGPDILGLVFLRQCTATLTGCAIARAYTVPGRSIIVDGGGPHSIVGGECRAMVSSPPLFELAGRMEGKIHMMGVSTGGHKIMDDGREGDFVIH